MPPAPLVQHFRGPADPAADEKARPRPGLLVDRDGVLNTRIPGGYVLRPAELECLDAVLPALARASAAGVPIAIVSNQGALSRRLMSESDLRAIHADLVAHLERAGVRLGAIYVCPHHPAAADPDDRACGCRKPAPGLLQAAAADLGLDLARSVLIGDQESDRQAGLAAGLTAERVWLVQPERMGPAQSAGLAAQVAEALGLP